MYLPRLNNVRIAIGLALTWLLFIPALYLVERQNLFELLNAIIMAACAGVAVGYLPEFWKAIKLPVHKLDAAQVLIIGMVVGCFGCIGVFGVQWVWRTYREAADGNPYDWLIDSPFSAFTRWVTISGILLILVAARPDSSGSVPAHAYWRAGAFVAFALTTAAILITFGFG